MKIEVENLTKVYGDKVAVDDLSFQVDKGEILGFLGPNGAGKSTTMRMLTCFISPTSGTARVNDMDIIKDPLGVRKQIGYLPESAPIYRDFTIREFLAFMGELRELYGQENKQRVQEVMETTSLLDVQHQTIDTLSKGYRQRVCLAQALIHDPPVLILDEPTDGLDPNQKHEVRRLIKKMSEDKVIILSTHILEEMEAICSRSIIINNGKLVADTTPEKLVQMADNHNSILLGLNNPLSEADLIKITEIDSVDSIISLSAEPKDGLFQYKVVPKEKKNILHSLTIFLREGSYPIEEIHLERGRIDQVFRKITLEERV